MTRTLGALLASGALLLAACASAPPSRPAGWNAPEIVATGVDVGADGTIYFSANKNNAIYRVRPIR